MSTLTFVITFSSVAILLLLIDSGLFKLFFNKLFKKVKITPDLIRQNNSLSEEMFQSISQVDYTTPDKEFDDFIDDSFVKMCQSRNKVKYKVEYDNVKNEIILHYTDGTADRVTITPVKNYRPKEKFIGIKVSKFIQL